MNATQFDLKGQDMMTLGEMVPQKQDSAGCWLRYVSYEISLMRRSEQLGLGERTHILVQFLFVKPRDVV